MKKYFAIKDNSFFPSVFDQALVSGGSFLLLALGSHFLSMADQGKLGYINTAYIATIVINQALIFQWANVKTPTLDNKEEYQRFLFLLQTISASTIASVLTILLFIYSSFSGWQLLIKDWILLALFLLIQQITDFGRRSSYVFYSPTQAMFNSLFVYPARIAIIWILKPTNISAFLLILILTSVPMSIYTVFKNRKAISVQSRFMAWTKQHLHEVNWLLISSPFSFVWAMIPIYIGGYLLTLNEIGLYTSLNSINNVGNVAMELLETEFSSKLGKIAINENQRIKKFIRNTLALGVIFWFAELLVLLMFRKTIILIVAGSDYLIGQDLLLLMWGGVIFMFLFRVDTVLLRTYGKTKSIFWGLVIGTGVSLVASPPLINLWGVYGIVASSIIATFFIYLYQRTIILKQNM